MVDGVSDELDIARLFIGARFASPRGKFRNFEDVPFSEIFENYKKSPS